MSSQGTAFIIVEVIEEKDLPNGPYFLSSPVNIKAFIHPVHDTTITYGELRALMKLWLERQADMALIVPIGKLRANYCLKFEYKGAPVSDDKIVNPGEHQCLVNAHVTSTCTII